jgi:hypothetical protein
MTELIEQHRVELAELCRLHHVETLEVFGSAADGRFDPQRSSSLRMARPKYIKKHPILKGPKPHGRNEDYNPGLAYLGRSTMSLLASAASASSSGFSRFLFAS